MSIQATNRSDPAGEASAFSAVIHGRIVGGKSFGLPGLPGFKGEPDDSFSKQTSDEGSNGEPVRPIDADVTCEVAAGPGAEYDSERKSDFVGDHRGRTLAATAGAVVQMGAVRKAEAQTHNHKRRDKGPQGAAEDDEQERQDEHHVKAWQNPGLEMPEFGAACAGHNEEVEYSE